MSDSAPPPPPPENPYGQNPPPSGPAYGQNPQGPAYGQNPQGPAYPQNPQGPAYGQNPYGAPGGYPAPGVGGPGPLLDRFVAKLIDWVLLMVVNFVIGAVIIGGIIGGGGSIVGTGGSFAYSILSSIVSAAIVVGYFTLMESKRGQTLGKMVMKLRVLGPDGQSMPTTGEAFKRNAYTGYSILGIIPILGPFLGLIVILVADILIAVGINGDPVHGQAWHDKFAGGTRVIKVG